MNKVQTVAESFAGYQADVIPADAPRIQVEECRRAFYAGVYFMLMNLQGYMAEEDTPEEVGIAILEAIQHECETFAAPLGGIAAIAPPAMLMQSESRYTIPDPAEINPLMQELGRNIGAKLPKGWGYNLLLFTFGEKGSLFYISNADRSDVMSVMREWISRQIQ